MNDSVRLEQPCYSVCRARSINPGLMHVDPLEMSRKLRMLKLTQQVVILTTFRNSDTSSQASMGTYAENTSGHTFEVSNAVVRQPRRSSPIRIESDISLFCDQATHMKSIKKL